MSDSTSATTYAGLLAMRGMRPLFASMFLSRLANFMWGLVLVLFALDRFHSSFVAGAVAAVALAPSVIISPLTGALLDRYGRRNLILADLCLAMGVAASVLLLDAAGLLHPGVLIILVAVAGLTTTFTNSGIRALVPAMIDRRLWDRANGLDTAGSLLAVAGAGLGGAIFSLLGRVDAVLAVAIVWLAAAIAVAMLPIAGPPPGPRRQLTVEMTAGLRYLAGNPVLRALSATIVLSNVAAGAVNVAIPVLLVTDQHAPASAAGLFFTVYGLASVLGGLVLGRISTTGREKRLMLCGLAARAIGFGLIALVPTIYAIGAGAVVAGAGNGPFGVGFTSLRQRASSPEMFGRVLAVSMSLNTLGVPVGAFLAGLAPSGSGRTALILTTAVLAAAAVATAVLLPRSNQEGVR
jgi:MFS family permease